MTPFFLLHLFYPYFSKGSAINYTHFIQPTAFTHLHSFFLIPFNAKTFPPFLPLSSFLLPFLNSCIPFLFICVCYSMLYLFYLPRYSFFLRSLQRLSYSLLFINLIFSSDTAFLLHSFCLIIPKCTAFSCTHLSLSTPTTSLSHYTHFIEFPQTNLKIRQSTFSSIHHSHPFSSPYLFIFIPFIFICACYNMLYSKVLLF